MDTKNLSFKEQQSLDCKNQYEGNVYNFKNSDRQFVVKEYNSYSNVLIEHEPSGYTKRTNIYNIQKGLQDPFAKSCICFDTPQHEYEGCIYRSNSDGDLYQVIKYQDYHHVTIKFLDNDGYEFTTTLQNVKKGQIKNPYHRLQYGNYIGRGIYNCEEYGWLYTQWYNIFNRVYNTKAYNESRQYAVNSYDNCFIVEEWKCFNTFAEWYMNNYNQLNKEIKYDIDKDVLFGTYYIWTNGRKCYGPNTCMLIPHDLNNSIQIISHIGKYKKYNPIIRDKLIYVAEKTKYYNNIGGLIRKDYETIISIINNILIANNFNPISY